jgi:hypothetical protein
MDRYARQRLLAVVGDPGQSRIAGATFSVDEAASPAAQVEREYLTRAGATQFLPRSGPAPEFAHAAAFSSDAARDFGGGAWRALAQLRSILELSS